MIKGLFINNEYDLSNFSAQTAVILYMPINTKNSLKLLLLLSFSSPVQAGYFEDNYLFGASYIQQYANLKAERGSASETGNGFGVYLDIYVKHRYRINSTLGYIHYNAFDITEMTFSVDYLFPIKTSVSAFAGIALGGAHQKYRDTSLSDAASGKIVGVQIGAIKYIDNSHLLEVGFRQRNADIRTIVDSIPVSEITLENLNEAYISVLFMF